MTEQLLQFIWQFQYFNKGDFFTAEGETLQIINPGTHNKNQGPDFLNAKIKIGNTLLAGSIEIHIDASEWNLHKHSNDENYKNVILHVVWKEDKKLGFSFPTLELHQRVSNLLLDKYENMMNSSVFIPCENHLNTISEISFTAWKERLLVERLQEKAALIEKKLAGNNHHWEEIFWHLLAKNFGIKINADAFEAIARSVPLSILAKHKNQLHQLEALLLGQAGLLNNDFTDDYATMLKKEFTFLKVKYKLLPIHLPVHFLRMRPANFPTIRLSQLAMLVNSSTHLFAKIKEASTIKEVEQLFEVTANDYWHYHYIFDEESTFQKKNVGRQMIQNIIVNTVIPVLYAYGWYNDAPAFQEKALQWAAELLPEKNNITDGFVKLGIANKSAYDSQALIQLKNNYCNLKKCLQCSVGNSILKLN